jgi:hypothetical protein
MCRILRSGFLVLVFPYRWKMAPPDEIFIWDGWSITGILAIVVTVCICFQGLLLAAKRPAVEAIKRVIVDLAGAEYHWLSDTGTNLLGLMEATGGFRAGA